MNFLDIYKKVVAIDSGAVTESKIDECGGMMPEMPKQQDNVTMSVSMNGSGAGGIRDLMSILKNLEQGGEEGGEVIIATPGGAAGHEHGHEEPLIGDSEVDEVYSNQPAPATAGVEAVTQTGNDLASKGDEAEKVNGGGNPFNVDESLVNRLSQLYTEIKTR